MPGSFTLRYRVALLALLTLCGSCYKKGDYDLTSEEVNQILSLASVSGQTTLPADGFSQLQIVAQILSEADEDKRTIVFTTTAGSFEAAEEIQELELDADADGNAVVSLQSAEKIGTVTVQAQVKNVSNLVQQLVIQFVDVQPSDIIQFISAPRTAPADGFSESLFEVQIADGVPADQRLVTFKTTAGTFVNSGAAEEMVDAATASRASVLLQSPLDVTVGQVSASVAGVTISANISFREVDIDDFIKFIIAPTEAPADGATVTRFTVKVSEAVPAAMRIVKFETSAGKFLSTDGAEAEISATAAGRANAQLVSPGTITMARVRATVMETMTVEADIQFYRALPDNAIEVRANPLQLEVTSDAQASIVATLLRDVGTVTEGTKVTFKATTAGGSLVGILSNVTRSDNMGQALATFLPASTSYRGEVEITAFADTPDGEGITGRTFLTLLEPTER